MTPSGDDGAQVDTSLTNRVVKTASIPIAAAPEEAESSHNSITVTSQMQLMKPEVVCHLGQHPHSREPCEAQTLRA